MKGSGNATAFVIADETNGTQKLFTFDLGALSLSAQSGFTLTAINGETIDSFRVFTTGNLTDFEHYRIDIASPQIAAVPEASTWAMLILGFAGIGLMGLRQRGRKFRLV